ncbi:MAG: Uncharacterized protein Athens041674_570 [Parcubacteria group bacterium Athens0416_74]|nr:MAG: Uncharacterized protein Athens041674_570 [Parcubacteria group bacterium Athens0416_74]
MKIFLIHSRHFDFETELYAPLRRSALNESHELIFPHDGGMAVKTKDIIKSADVVVAEVSKAGTGIGIELGWADAFDRPILCIHKEGTQLSGSLQYLTENVAAYSNDEELVQSISEFVSTI